MTALDERSGDTSNSCRDISLKTTNVNFMVAIEEKKENHQSLEDRATRQKQRFKTICPLYRVFSKRSD